MSLHLYDFNRRECGIFADGYQDRDGVPVGDVFAYLLRASLYGAYGKDWPKEKLAALIRCFSSEQLAALADDESLAKWHQAITGAPVLHDRAEIASRESLRRIYAEALLVPELQPDQVMSVWWDRDGLDSGFMVRRDGDYYVAEEWRNGDIVDNHSFKGAGALALAYGWILLERQQHLDWRFEQGALLLEFMDSAPDQRADDHAVVTSSDLPDTRFMVDLAYAVPNHIVNRLTIVAGAQSGWALPYPKRDVLFQDHTREFWEPPSAAAVQAAARIREDAPNLRHLYRNEFPSMGELEFSPAELGFPIDASWHNDTCASFETDDGLYRLWVAERVASDREFPEMPRFAIYRNEPGGLMGDGPPLFDGETLDELKAFVAKANFKVLQERGRTLAAPRG